MTKILKDASDEKHRRMKCKSSPKFGKSRHQEMDHVSCELVKKLRSKGRKVSIRCIKITVKTTLKINFLTSLTRLKQVMGVFVDS